MICKAGTLSQIAGDAVPEQVPVDVPSLRFDRQKRPPGKEEDWKGSAAACTKSQIIHIC